MKMHISFDKSLKGQFMAAQKLSVDDSGYLFDSVADSRVMDSNKQPIKAKNFGGMRKGSRIFLAKDISTVLYEAKLDNQQSSVKNK